MLHLLQQPTADESPLAYAEAVSRLSSVRHALRLVEPFGAGPAPDIADDQVVADAWEDAGEARQQLFERRSARMVGAAAAGIEAVLTEREEGREPHAEASHALAEEIRRELREVARIVLR
jgi:hypothetical protein